MLRNYSKTTMLKMAIVLPLWVMVSFYTAQYLLIGSFWLLNSLGISFENADSTIVNTVVAAILYVLSLAIVMVIPYLLVKSRTTKEEIGLQRLPSWTDILITPAGLIVYFFASFALMAIAAQIVPGFDADQVQTTGFEGVNQQYELLLTFFALVILAPVAEEILFRGYLYGKLKKYMPIWVAVVVTSITFGFVHGSWNLAVDTFALGIMLCVLREMTGSLWPSILLHMSKNGIAFYFLFINTSL